MILRISLLLMLVSVLGCASQIDRVQTTQLTTERGRTSQKTGTADHHLSPWILEVRLLQSNV